MSTGSGYPLTEQELAYIKSGLLSSKELSTYLGRSQECIAKRAREMGIILPRDNLYHTCYEDMFSVYNPISVYWAGFIAADGNINKYKNRLTLSIKKEDEGHLYKFKYAIRGTQKIKEKDNNGYYQVRFRISSEKLCRDLESNFGIIPNKSLKLRFPDSIPVELEHHFIRGYFDGDGTIGVRKNETPYIIILGTQKFLNSIVSIFRKRYTNDTIGSISTHNNSNIYRLYLHGRKSVPAFITYLYQDSTFYTRLDRKYSIVRKIT